MESLWRRGSEEVKVVDVERKEEAERRCKRVEE